MVYGMNNLGGTGRNADQIVQKQQQQKDEQAQGTTQKKKKVTAAQLRVQKGEEK